MVYAVKKISEISGVSVRTLHYYEEEGLLKPAYYGKNGYRYYGEKELLQLQQILFYKELGFTIKQIKKVLGKGDFDLLAALCSHKQVLTKEHERMARLIETVDKTIQHIKGQKSMKAEELYEGFKQKEYEAYIKNRYGDRHFKECEKNVKNWSKADWEKSGQEWESNLQLLATLKKKGISPDATEVQSVIRNVYLWLKKFWTPDRESFIGRGQGYTEFEWKKAFEKYDPEHPKLAMFLAEGMKIFAEKEL